MDRAGTKRSLGVALLASGVLMLVLGGLFWGGVFGVDEEARPILGAALLLAGLIDMGIGLKFMQAAGAQ